MYLFEWFSEYRFANIPAKAPNSPSQFLSEMYFCLLDVFPQIQFSDFPLIDDDFNLVGHKAETGKNDTTKLATAEHNKQDAKHNTEADILTHGVLKQTSSASTENIDDETNQNTKQNQDVFLSPQNQGVTPNNVSTIYKGVDGVTLNPSSGFTTNTQNSILGDTVRGKTNTSAQAQQAEEELTQDSDARTAHETGSEIGMQQEQENTTAKNDSYIEQLDFNRSARLQEYYNLGKDRLWLEILSRLSRWILQIDIATAERNYNDCPIYD